MIRARLRLSPFAFQRLWDVHTWSGVITSWVLYVMFVLGAVVLFYRPLRIWEEPQLQRAASPLPPLQRLVESSGAFPEEAYLYLPDEGRGAARIAYYLPGTEDWREFWIDPERGVADPQREIAAAYVYDLHAGYWAKYGAGLLVFGFLLALLTGVLVHLKDLARQFQRFRPQLGDSARARRVLWSDLHKVTGVIGFPFQFIYALTGGFMVVGPLLFPLYIGPVFGGDARRAAEAVGNLIDDVPPQDYGAPAPSLSLDELAARARAAEPRLVIESFVLHGLGRELATVDVRGPIEGESFGKGIVTVRATDGSIAEVQTPERQRLVGTLGRWINGLHIAEYGGNLVRVLLFVLTLGGCACILTGNWVWLERRAASSTGFGYQLLARLTAGVGSGALVAIGALFLSSRLLPFDWPARIAVEKASVVVALVVCIGAALVSRRTLASWWRWLGVSGLLLVAVPIAALRHSQAGLFGPGPMDATVFAVDVAFLATGLLLLAGAFWIRNYERRHLPAIAPEFAPVPARLRRLNARAALGGNP